MSVQTRPGQFHVQLRPVERGAFTEWRISGSTPTALRPWQLARLMQAMSFWSGWPVVLALSVELETAVWSSWWLDMLADIPSEDLVVRIVGGHVDE